MFESASTILDQYLSVGTRQLWRFDIYSMATVRGENPSDLYYLCNVRNVWVIVFETDYIFSLEETLKEAREIFESDELKITRWLAKKDAQGNPSALPLAAANDKSQRERLILDIENTYLRCAVLATEVSGRPPERYNPAVYGHAV